MADVAAVKRDQFYTPEHLAVIPEVRALLKRVLKVESNTLEFAGEDFTGFITFRVPTNGTYESDDVLTICAELAQEDLGVTAFVETWFIKRPAEGLISLQPHEFDLQEEDRGEPDPVSRREFMSMVEPSEGWGR